MTILPHSRTAAQPHSRTAAQPHSRTAAQSTFSVQYSPLSKTMTHTPHPLLRRLILVLLLLVVGCGASAAQAATTTPPERVLRDFYTALDNDRTEEAEALLSHRSKLTDPKGGSLLGNTASSIGANEGIAKFDVLKVGEEEMLAPEEGSEKQRTVTVEFEITFKNGESRRSESILVYEPEEYGWRVEAIRAVWED